MLCANRFVNCATLHPSVNSVRSNCRYKETPSGESAVLTSVSSEIAMADERFTTDDLMLELKYSNDIREIIENAVNKFQSCLAGTERNILDRVQCLEEKVDSSTQELKAELAKEKNRNIQLTTEIKSLRAQIVKLNETLKNCGTAEDFTTQSASGTSSFESLDCSGLFAGDNDQLEGLKVGMRLEAVDKKNPHLICVATVDKKTGDNQILIHFDGWSRHFDYTTTINDLALHPVGFCERKSLKLEAPKDWCIQNPECFSWSTYLTAVQAEAVPDSFFTEPASFAVHEESPDSGPIHDANCGMM